MDDRRPRVFVSYAHDSARHKRAVLRLCTLLRDECAIDVHFDQWYEKDRQDWALWVIEQLELADFVIVVASPKYKRRAEGRVPAHEGRGAQYEAGMLRDKLTQNWKLWTKKMLPVVLPGRTVADIPAFLQPFAATRYHITRLTTTGLAELVCTLRGGPEPKGVDSTVMTGSDWEADDLAATPRQTAFGTDNSSVQQAGRDIHNNNFSLLPVIVIAAVVAIVVTVWLIWPKDESNATGRWREVLRWNEFSLKEAAFACTDGVVDKVDLDTGKPGRGSQPQIPGCEADGGYAELVLEDTTVHTYSKNALSILLVPADADLTADTCDRMIKAADAELRHSVWLDDLHAGDQACIRTDEGKLARVTFTQVPSNDDPRLLIDFVVWSTTGGD